MTAVSDLIANIQTYKYNPAGIASAALNVLEDVNNGTQAIVDPTNPLAYLIECAATMTAAWMVEDKALNRKEYAITAQTAEDLYPHISDQDYVGVFASPATAPILFVMNKNELMNALVPLNDGTGESRLVIPRNTTVTVAGVTFSLQYPIMIRQLVHGGLQVVYDVSQPSPLQTLTSNIITWRTLTNPDGTQLVAFEVVMTQFDIVVKTGEVSLSQPTIVTVPLADNNQYYYTRVWIQNADGSYTEMATTYTDATYDVLTPTAVIKVIGSTVQVKIPLVYVTTGLITGKIRVDVYETLGALNMSLVNYTPDQYVTKFLALNKSDQTVYTAPWNSFSSFYAYSIKTATGGGDALAFEDLRTRVITNAIGSPSLPITNVQIANELDRAGYSIVKNIDTVTNRNFLATRPMPAPTDPNLITAAAAGIGVLSTKLADALALTSVIDNGDGYTIITPDTLYRWNAGVLQFVSSAEVTTLKAMSAEQLSLAITSATYMFSPFHYVMDSSQNEFNLRPYYLDNPSVSNKSFVATNDTTLLEVTTDSLLLSRTSTGYKLHIQTLSSSAFQALPNNQVFVQLAYIPPGEIDRAYLLGTLISQDSTTGERVYEFDLSTNFSIDPNHYLGMTKLQMYNATPRITRLPLDQTFDILYSTNAALGSQWQPNAIDPLLGAFQLSGILKGVTHETVDLNFGVFLENLWARSRTVVSANQYATWAVDVPATYAADVYQPDPVTGIAFTVVSGNVVYNVLHHAGDPILDTNGQPTYKYRKGDIKLDAYGNPIIVQGRDLLRQMDVFMMDATYYFATNQVATDYVQQLVNTVVNWITVDLAGFDEGLLEETEIFYHPTTTIGSVDVLYGNGLTTTILAGQSFVLNLSVSAKVYADVELRNTLTSQTITTIANGLTQPIVAMSDIVNALRTAYSTDVIGFDISGLGGTLNLQVASVIDGSQRLSLNKRLVARSDNTLAVVEDVTINWLRYEQS